MMSRNKIFYMAAMSLASIVLFFACLLIADHIIIPCLEGFNILPCSMAWEKENDLINALNRYKIPRNRSHAQNNIWQSDGFPVTIDKHKAKRILILGDSFVWGDGYMNMNDLWWRQLERELIERGYGDIQVIAAGHCGWGTSEEFLAAKQWIPLYNPDAVIFGYVTNDPDMHLVEQYNPDTEKLFGPLDKGMSFLFPHLYYMVKKRYADFLCKHPPSGRYEYSQWELEILHGDNFAEYSKMLTELGLFVRSQRIPIFFIALPNSPSPEQFEARYVNILKLFRDNKINFYNILDDFVNRYPHVKNNREFCINPANGHPGAISNHFFAVEAANILEKEYPIVLGQKGIAGSIPCKINDWTPAFLNPVFDVNGTIKFSFPPSSRLLHLPIHKPYISFHFENPCIVSKIRLTGNIKSARIWYSVASKEKGYDDGKLYQLSAKKGNDLVWDLTSLPETKRVNTLRLNVDFNSSDRNLALSITCR